MDNLDIELAQRSAHFASPLELKNFDSSLLPIWTITATSPGPDDVAPDIRELAEKTQWLYYWINECGQSLTNPETADRESARERYMELLKTKDLLNEKLKRLNCLIESKTEGFQAVSLRLNTYHSSQQRPQYEGSASRTFKFALPQDFENLAANGPIPDEVEKIQGLILPDPEDGEDHS